MKSFSNQNRLSYLILLGICALSLFFNIYKQDTVPSCFNNDEAAFGYNAYSLAQTWRDEYGTLLPLRLKSFGDYKMPLYSYLSVPFVGTLGLTEQSSGMLNTFLAMLFPLVSFLLMKELTGRTKTALITAFLVSTSLSLHIVGRHVHEAYLAAFLTTTASYLFIKYLKRQTLPHALFFLGSLLLLLFSYHPGRVFALFFFLYTLFHLYTEKPATHSAWKKAVPFLVGFLLVVGIFALTDVVYKPERVKNLLFFNNAGFSLKIDELRGEGSPRLLYNKVTVGIRDVANQYVQYYSPQFLAVDGDSNYRFGYPGMAPLTILEYIFLFIGLFFLFKNRERWRYFLVGLLLIAPASASLSWASASLTRALFLPVIVLLISGYGIGEYMHSLSRRSSIIALVIIILAQSFFAFYSWDFYLNHYPKRARVIRAWQCGYTELGAYIKQQYPTTEKFYMTKKHGMPYIMMLFHLKYPPEKYFSQAALTPPDEYGFGQVEGFDKFDFNFRLPLSETNYVAVGYPDDFNGAPEEIRSQIKKITIGTEEIFWIYKK